MDIVRRMDSRAAQRALERLYGERADKQLWRYKALAKKFAERFGREDFKFFSAPGRTEYWAIIPTITAVECWRVL